MANEDPRIDKYIEEAAEFAKPILRHIRGLVHKAAPEIQETIKWSAPFFEHKGPVCNMAAFKEHCSVVFWKPSLIKGLPAKVEGMGALGKIRSLKDLPKDKEFIDFVRQAFALNEQGIKVAAKPKTAPKELVVPEELMKALRTNAKARGTWEKFSYSHRKEYAEWIAEAKREETKKTRMEKTILWLSEGKSRHWKHQGC
jgi:uncharacterized protein YdeI (YjbR/CyaY-like superfamily)